MPTNFIKTKHQETMWEKSKNIVLKEYPNVPAGSEQFYKLSMGTYKKMNKLATAEETINSLFKEGALSYTAKEKFDNEKLRLEICGSVLEKSAGPLADNLKSSLMTGAIAALTTGGILGGSRLIEKLHSKLNRQKKLKEIYKFSPTIKDMDPSFVHQILDDVESLNPDYARSPMITGKIIKDSFINGGLGPDQANTLKDKDSDSLFAHMRDTALDKAVGSIKYKAPKQKKNKDFAKLEKSLGMAMHGGLFPKKDKKDKKDKSAFGGVAPKSTSQFGSRLHETSRNTPAMFGQRIPKNAEDIFSAEELF